MAALPLAAPPQATRQPVPPPRPAPARAVPRPTPPAEAPSTVWRPPGRTGAAEQGAAEQGAAQATGGGAASGAIVPPRALAGASNPPPEYPRSARLRGEQGRVRLLVQVDLSGRVTHAAVLGSSGHAALDQAAEAAVRRWRFEPATQQGQPVFSTTTVNITFRLEQDAFAPRR
jgi:protein TonB